MDGNRSFDRDGGKYDFKAVYKKELYRRVKGLDSQLSASLTEAISIATFFKDDGKGNVTPSDLATKKHNWDLDGSVESPLDTTKFAKANANWSKDKSDANLREWDSPPNTGITSLLDVFVKVQQQLERPLAAEAPDRKLRGSWRVALNKLKGAVEALPITTKEGTTHPGPEKYKEVFLSDLKNLETEADKKLRVANQKYDWEPPVSYLQKKPLTAKGFTDFSGLCRTRWHYKQDGDKAILKKLAWFDLRRERWEKLDKSKTPTETPDKEVLKRYATKLKK